MDQCKMTIKGHLWVIFVYLKMTIVIGQLEKCLEELVPHLIEAESHVDSTVNNSDGYVSSVNIC